MTLDLNENNVPYKEFYGKSTDQMPLLIADGRVSLTVAGLMERRVNSQNTAWKDNYFFLGDAFAYKDEKFKVVLNAQPLKEITSKSKLNNGALVLPDGMYEQLKGEEFKIADLKSVTGRDLTSDEAKAHPVWKAFAGNNDFLNAYVDRMFPEMKTRFGYDTAMGVYLNSANKVPTLRAGIVNWLDYNRSRLNGVNCLDGDDGRLVGVAPEVLSAPGKVIMRPSLEQSLSVLNLTSPVNHK